MTNGTIQPIIDPTDRRAVPGQHHSGGPHQPARAEDAQPAAAPNSILNLQPGRSGRRIRRSTLTPEHGRTEQCRSDRSGVHRQNPQSFKMMKDRDDTWSYNNFTPGTGHVNNNTPGILLVLDGHAGAQAHRRERNELRVHAQPVGLQSWSGGSIDSTTPSSMRRRSASIRRGCSRLATTPIRRTSPGLADRRWTSGRMRRGSARAVATARVWRATSRAAIADDRFRD